MKCRAARPARPVTGAPLNKWSQPFNLVLSVNRGVGKGSRDPNPCPSLYVCHFVLPKRWILIYPGLELITPSKFGRLAIAVYNVKTTVLVYVLFSSGGNRWWNF